RFVRLHLGQPLPRLRDTAGPEDLRDLEVAVADEALTDVVAGDEDVDAGHAVTRLGPVRPAIPEQLPHLFRWCRHHERVVVLLQGVILPQLQAWSPGSSSLQRQNSLPPGSRITWKRPPSSSTTPPERVAPSPSAWVIASLRSSTFRSRWSRFLPCLGSG